MDIFSRKLRTHRTLLLLIMFGCALAMALHISYALTLGSASAAPVEIQAPQEAAAEELDPDICGLSNVECPSKAVYGHASWYDYTLESGWSSKGHRVCATRSYPRYVTLLVTDLDTGKTVECYTTDYGPDKSLFPERVVDLSSTAFEQLAPLSAGVLKNIKVEQVNEEDNR
jgi:rare lipoprotein A (peptidoglycan hydrolase)